MPCDMEPVADGKFFMFRKPDWIESENVKNKSERAERAKTRGQKTYSCHFETCKNKAVRDV